MDELVKLVEQWSIDRKLNQADSSKQYQKVGEEFGEIGGALSRQDQDELRDAIGDTVVTLIILAQQNDMDLYECLNAAYDEIKDRKGKTVNGVFIKEDELKLTNLADNGEVQTFALKGKPSDVIRKMVKGSRPDSAFEQIMNEIYISKNTDYGNSYSDSFEKIGSRYAVGRILDKTNRLVQVTTAGKQLVSDESIRDTLLDLENYCVLMIMELDKNNASPNKSN